MLSLGLATALLSAYFSLYLLGAQALQALIISHVQPGLAGQDNKDT